MERAFSRTQIACVDPTGTLRDDVEFAIAAFFPGKETRFFSSFQDAMDIFSHDCDLNPFRNDIFALLIDAEAISPEEALELARQARTSPAIPNVGILRSQVSSSRTALLDILRDDYGVDFVDPLDSIVNYFRSLHESLRF